MAERRIRRRWGRRCGATAYVVESNLPPVLVIGAAFVVMFFADRYEL